MSDIMDSYAFFMLFSYFMFLFGILYMTQNAERVAQHPYMERLVEKIQYNLRDLPRVNYKEISSDEEDSQSESLEKDDSQSESLEKEDSQEEVTSEASLEESNEPSEELRKRRDRNPISRMIEEIY
jgi:hypothetical protein